MSLSTGADSPQTITHGFVLKGFDLVFSMLNGERDEDGEHILNSKTIENRHGRLAPGWYAVILGKGTKSVTKERYDRCRSLLPNMLIPEWNAADTKEWLAFRKGCAVGAVRVAHSLPHNLCKDSPWAEGPVCNIIAEAGWFDRPVPTRGNLGACPINDEEAREQIRGQANNAYVDGNIKKTNGEALHPYRGPEVWLTAKKRAAKGCIDLRDKDDVGKLRRFLLQAQVNLQAKRQMTAP